MEKVCPQRRPRPRHRQMASHSQSQMLERWSSCWRWVFRRRVPGRHYSFTATTLALPWSGSWRSATARRRTQS